MTDEPKNGLSMLAQRLPRIVALRKAGEMIGQGRLAECLGLEPRSLRAKIGADRGIWDGELVAAAVALERAAQEMLVQAETCRRLGGNGGPARDTGGAL